MVNWHLDNKLCWNLIEKYVTKGNVEDPGTNVNEWNFVESINVQFKHVWIRYITNAIELIVSAVQLSAIQVWNWVMFYGNNWIKLENRRSFVALCVSLFLSYQ